MIQTSKTHTGEAATAPWIVVSGLDGAGKTALVENLGKRHDARRFKLPYHDFVKPALERSGNGQPYADVLTDRLLFALDARLTNYLIADWRHTEPLLVSQRGWVDNYVFGAVQGVSWAETGALLQPCDLERPTAVIHLLADPDVAFERIRNDPTRDKYETLSFMRRQYVETRRFFEAVESGDNLLAPFLGVPNLLIDTTALQPEEVCDTADAFLHPALSGAQG